jgi:hypothetical protein
MNQVELFPNRDDIHLPAKPQCPSGPGGAALGQVRAALEQMAKRLDEPDSDQQLLLRMQMQQQQQ